MPLKEWQRWAIWYSESPCAPEVVSFVVTEYAPGRAAALPVKVVSDSK